MTCSLLDTPSKRPRRESVDCAPVIAIDSRIGAEPFVMLPVASGEVAIVDLPDLHLVAGHCWYMDNRYPAASINGTSTRLHRVIEGEVAPELVVDHRNGDRFDNRRTNLRIVTPAENAKNRPGTAERQRQLAAIRAQLNGKAA